MNNPLDAHTNFKAAWERLKTEMDWAAKTGHGPFRVGGSREDHARAVVRRMEQIEAFLLVSEMIATPSRLEPTVTLVDPESGPWVVVDSWPAPLLYWSPVLGWAGLPDQAGVFLAYRGADDTADEHHGVVVPLAAIGRAS